MKEIINLLKVELRATREQTHAILDALSDKGLVTQWDRPGLDTFAKHFVEMSEVQTAYAEALTTGTMNFSKVTNTCPEDITVDKLKTYLRDAEANFESATENCQIDKIDWFGESVSLMMHLTRLLTHEVFHHGMMTLQMYQQDIQIPECMKDAWALPLNEKAEMK